MITQFDVEHLEDIIADSRGIKYDWFTAGLLRLMAKADSENAKKLAYMFPDEFIQFCKWKYGGVPSNFITIDTVRGYMEYDYFGAIDWVDSDGKPVHVQIKHGRDF